MSEEPKPIARRWTSREIGIIIDTYPDHGLDKTLALLPGRTMGSLMGVLKRLYLKRSKETKYKRKTNSKPKPPKKPWVLKPETRKRQNETLAKKNKSVDVNFFEAKNSISAYVVGVIWSFGKVQTAPKKKLIISVPKEKLNLLEEIKQILKDKHKIQETEGKFRLEIASAKLVEDLIKFWGDPPKPKQKGDLEDPEIPPDLRESYQQGRATKEQ